MDSDRRPHQRKSLGQTNCCFAAGRAYPDGKDTCQASRLCSLDYFGYILGKRRFIEVSMGIEQRQVGHSALPGSNLLARAIALLQRAKLFQVVSLHLQHLLNQVSGFGIIELGEVFFQFLDQPLLVIHQSGQKMTEGNEMTFCEALVKNSAGQHSFTPHDKLRQALQHLLFFVNHAADFLPDSPAIGIGPNPGIFEVLQKGDLFPREDAVEDSERGW
jgi:hypothetical protein